MRVRRTRTPSLPAATGWFPKTREFFFGPPSRGNPYGVAAMGQRGATRRRRQVPPAWFPAARLGVFVHWGLFSVPAWAPRLDPGETMVDLLRHDPRHLGARLPYAEWYRNALALADSPTAVHHRATYGDAPYEAFQAEFERGLDRWDPDRWADQFAAAGARYVVMVTKHHDGYCLWPSAVAHPVRTGWHSGRDLVGELADAVRARGLRFGVYYSAGLDWSVSHLPIRQPVDIAACTPRGPAYRQYATAQLDELVERYRPSVVWGDMGAPPGFDLAGFIERYRRTVPDGVVNDRWNAPLPGAHRPVVRRVLNGLAAAVLPRLPAGPTYPGSHRLAHFRTPEYSWPTEPVPFAWETTRGMGTAFGHNTQERDEDLIAPDRLVADFAEIVGLGGNLLVNVGPLADGTITDAEARRLDHLGRWIADHPSRS